MTKKSEKLIRSAITKIYSAHSTGPAAVSGRQSSPPLLAGGRGKPPLCIGKQEVGTYLYSLLHTMHRAPGLTS
jgi:hypothetical protein